VLVWIIKIIENRKISVLDHTNIEDFSPASCPQVLAGWWWWFGKGEKASEEI
jgi:hypothetical protein